MISQSDLFKLFRMISRCVISCDECALRFYVCSIFVDRVFVLFIFHHGVHWTYKCFAYVAPRGCIWVRRGLCGFRDIRGSVGRYDPWGIKATGFAVTTKINHYAAVTLISHSWAVESLFGGAVRSMEPGHARDSQDSPADVPPQKKEHVGIGGPVIGAPQDRCTTGTLSDLYPLDH